MLQELLTLLAYNGSWLSGRTVGLAVLIAIAAFVIGYVVALVWPKAHNPQLFGFLAAVGFVAALAAAGNTAAAMAIIIVVVAALLLAFAGVM